MTSKLLQMPASVSVKLFLTYIMMYEVVGKYYFYNPLRSEGASKQHNTQ